jgi:hypothetical protein
MSDDVDTLASEQKAPANHKPLTSTHTGSEPAVLARAQRILMGDVRSEDFLAVPEEVSTAVDDEVNRLVKFQGIITSAEFKTRMCGDWTLQYVYGGQPVACRYTDSGAIVFAVGLEEIRVLLERFTQPDHRSGFFITTPLPWETPTPLPSLSLSPQPLPHSG